MNPKKVLIKIFNQFIRERDKDKPCISCGIRPSQDAGHYWPTSTHPQPAMRFNEQNVHGQCRSCNRFKEGNRQGYREGLIKRYGEKILLDLDIKRSVNQNPWGQFEYLTMIHHYKQKVKALTLL